MEILEQEIAKIEASIDKYDEADLSVIYDSIDTITNAGYKSEAIEPLLQLFERHPMAYFGDPGAIVHFIEQFSGEYVEEFMGILKEIAGRTDVDKTIIERAQEYVDFQENR